MFTTSFLLLSLLPLVSSTEPTCLPDDTLPQSWDHLHPASLSSLSLAVLPLGAVEHHGPHLPLGTDLLLATALVSRALSCIPGAVMLPPSAYGASFEHARTRGTLAVQDLHLNGLWLDVLASVREAGLRKVLLVNAHGGQTPNVDIAVRLFRFRHDGLAVAFNVQAALMQAWRKVERRPELIAQEEVYGIHGGLVETAVMMYLHPELVKMERAEQFTPRREFENLLLQPYGAVVSFGWRAEDIFGEGAVGRADLASPELGGAILDEVVHLLRKLVQEVVNTDVTTVLHDGVS